MHDELIKSLVEAGFSEQEANDMLIEKSKTEKPKDIETEQEDDWSEEEERELEKACVKAQEIFDTYKSKRPKMKKEDVAKSDNSDIIQATADDTIIKGLFNEFESKFESKFSEIMKSIDSISDISSEIEDLREKIDGIGKNTPPQKSILKAESAILEKVMLGGVKQGNELHLSAKTHKEQICNEITSLIQENKNDTHLCKSLETDIMNYVAGAGDLGQTSRIALRNKGIFVG